MKIWIDGDACPAKVKEIIYKAAIRTETQAIIVANHFFSIPSSKWIKRVVVESGFDVADDKIIASVGAGDLVISADIPLAAQAIQKKALVLSPRGALYTEQNIKQALTMRDFNTTMRDAGILHSGPSPLNAQDIRRFANQLDTFLAS